MSVLAALWSDVRLGARALAKNPGLAATAIATLALGIGANSAVFSVVNAVLLRPLPYERPESRVMIWSRWVGYDKTWVSDAEVLDYRQLVPSLKHVAAWSTGQVNLTGDDDPVRVGSARVTANTFATLGATPLLGRGFEAHEERAGANAVAVVSHGLWQRRFGGDPAVVGRSILVDGVPTQLVGVMPSGFQLPTDFGEDAAEPTAVWLPLGLSEDPNDRGNHGLYAVAELVPGATAAGATAELDALLNSRTREGLYPPDMRMTAIAVPVVDEVVGGVRPALWLVYGAVTLLLLMACANVANLLLARAEVRQREIALRVALGAGRARLLRQLLAEGLVLAIPALALGLGLAWAALRVFSNTGFTGLPRVEQVAIDGRVLGFTVMASLATTLLFGLAPALRTLRLSLGDSLRDGGAATSAGVGRQRLRGALVASQLAVSVVLLVGAGLLLQSLWALQRVELGFEPTGVLTARIALPQSGYDKPESVVAFYQRLLERVRAISGVQHAGIIRSLPLGAQIGDWGLRIEGRPDTPGTRAQGDWQVASEGALEALGERLVRGRPFEATDVASGSQVALVNETMARTYWPGEDAIGRRFRMGSRGGQLISVVGVVRDVRHNGIRAPIKEKFYRPHAQFPATAGFAPRNMTLLLKTAADPLLLAGPLRDAVRELDPTLPVAALRPMSDVVAASLATPRLTGGLIAIFAVLALALAAVGIYGVLAYLVSRRSQEIGIQMAIGADRPRVLRLVMFDGLRLAAVGIAAGTLMALALSRLVASQLHGVKAQDPTTFAAVALLIFVVAALASYLPARRATLVDPLHALRTE